MLGERPRGQGGIPPRGGRRRDRKRRRRDQSLRRLWHQLTVGEACSGPDPQRRQHNGSANSHPASQPPPPSPLFRCRRLHLERKVPPSLPPVQAPHRQGAPVRLWRMLRLIAPGCPDRRLRSPWLGLDLLFKAKGESSSQGVALSRDTWLSMRAPHEGESGSARGGAKAEGEFGIIEISTNKARGSQPEGILLERSLRQDGAEQVPECPRVLGALTTLQDSTIARHCPFERWIHECMVNHVTMLVLIRTGVPRP